MNLVGKYFKKLFFLVQNEPKFLLDWFLNKFEILIYIFLFGPFLYINRLLPINKRVYFANFRSERIGHFTMGFYIRYAKVYQKKYNKNCLYCFNKDISNQFFAKKINEIFFVNRVIRFIIKIAKILPFLDCLIDREPIKAARDIEGITQKTQLPSIFNNKDTSFCHNWLKSYGWQGPNQKIICIHARDSLYLSKNFDRRKFKKSHWNYHSYRDANIDDFSESITWLIEQGYFVIRTGKYCHKKLKIESKSLIDYPFCKDQNDLLDIWLFANCDLVITTGSGIDEISTFYNVPKINVNYLPFSNVQTWSKSLTIPKHLYWCDTKKHLNFDEYMSLNFATTTEDYEKNNIKIKDLSSKELLNITQDGVNYFLNNKKIKINDFKITNLFKEHIKQNKELILIHDWVNNECIISSNLFKI